jgi:hypothetical protein
MCNWEDIVRAVISDDSAGASELLALDECLLATIKMKVRGRRIEPEEVASGVQVRLLGRWDNIRAAFVVAASERPTAAGIPLLRQKINWLISDALEASQLRNNRPKKPDDGSPPVKVFPLDPFEDGDGRKNDPDADLRNPKPSGGDRAERADIFWSRVANLGHIRSRVLIKFLGIIEGTTHQGAKLTEDERRWQPDPSLHPNSRTTGEVADALKRHLFDHRNLAAPNQWLGQEFRLTARKPQDLMAKWVERARRDFAETFKGDRDDLLN